MPARTLDPVLEVAIAAAREWAGFPEAMVLGGSHARGEAVAVEWRGGRVGLSDIDLYVVVADDAARMRAEAAAAAHQSALGARLREMGQEGAFELALHTPDSWQHLPARPATLELRRTGWMVAGDPGWLERLPAWTARDVPAEEVRLLLENRAFELIGARWDADVTEPIGHLRACHSQYKCALDLAGAERLMSGAYEPGAADRVRAARAETPREAGEEPSWDAALAWWRGVVPAAEEREADWWRIARCWVGCWSRAVAPGVDSADFERVALVAARRARLRRRVRMALRPEIRRGLAPPLPGRIGHVFSGTPQHRLNASAGALLAAACAVREKPSEKPRIRTRLARLVGRLGAVRSGGEEAVLARDLLDTWNRWVLAGQRRGVRG